MRVQVSPRALNFLLDFFIAQVYLISIMRTCLSVLTFTFLFVAISFAEVIKTGSFQANSDGVNVTLHWITEDETNVIGYQIERRTGTEGSFVSIATITAKGSSLYEFIDNSAFRKTVTLYQYQIKIIYANGTMVTYPGVLTVSHTVSGVRRTWGSIKAMFR